MIAACPECRTQYRVEPQRLSEEGVRLRCTRCQTIFRVRAPQTAPAVAPAALVAEPAARPQSADPRPAASPEPGGPTALAERLVLIATPDAENAKRWCDVLRGWGLEAESAHDGVEAILKVHRLWPAAVVLDPQLPKMFGFQVCEVIKRNESLCRIGVVLIGAIHHPQRYRRSPAELYGADAYVEEPDLPEALAPILRDLGLPIGPVEPGSARLPEAPAPAPDAPTLPPPVPAEATLPPTPMPEATLPPTPMPEATLPPTPMPEATLPPTPMPEATLPPTPMPEATLPPVPPIESTLPPAPLPEIEPAIGAALQPVPAGNPTLAPPELTLPPAVPEPSAVEAVAPAIGSPEYDVIDPDSMPVAAPELQPAVVPQPEPPAPVAVSQPMPAPMATPPPLAVPEPVAAPEPMLAPEPMAAPEPMPTPVAQPTPAPEPLMPEPVAAPEPVVPEPVAAPEPVVPEPVAAPEPVVPEPVAAPEPVVPEPVAAPEPVVPEPVAAPEPVVPEPVAAPEPVVPEPEPVAAPPEPAVDPEIEQAERLARIIISDVVLYNEDKFRASCEAGNLLEALEGDMADGRAHFASRVPEHVRNARDFLADELVRVAKSRGLM